VSKRRADEKYQEGRALEIFFWTFVVSIVLMLSIDGCKTPPAPLPTIDLAGLPYCGGSMDVASVCEGMFTDANYACFDCGAIRGCIDKSTMIYCADSCSDSKCHAVSDELHRGSR
jgi:hypothetical protein